MAVYVVVITYKDAPKAYALADVAFHNYSDALAHVEKLSNDAELQNTATVRIQCVSIY